MTFFMIIDQKKNLTQTIISNQMIFYDNNNIIIGPPDMLYPFISG